MTEAGTTPGIDPLGEAGWTLTLGREPGPAVHARVHAVAAAINGARLPAVLEVVPTSVTARRARA